MKKFKNPLADPENWDKDWTDKIWIYLGEETEPWLLAPQEQEESECSSN